MLQFVFLFNAIDIHSISGGTYEVIESSYSPENIFDPEFITLHPGKMNFFELYLPTHNADMIRSDLSGMAICLYGQNYIHILSNNDLYLINFTFYQEIMDGDWHHIQNPGYVSFKIDNVPIN